ncbi:MAG: hypothetical protein JOZ96_03515 [Acidobacteria bacterium]|nr:hypothetical protein [Acidobacteriota bacterium]
MNKRKSRYAEVVVRVVNKRVAASEWKPATENEKGELKRSYDALIYTDLTIPDLTPPPPDLAANNPAQIAELPLAGVETVVVHWSFYRQYLTSFIAGERAAVNKLWGALPPLLGGRAGSKRSRVRNLLFETPPKALQEIFRGKLDPRRPLRIWWGTPHSELVHLPWELLAYGDRGRANQRKSLSFVRGAPPEQAVPKVPVSGPLRLALIGDPQQMPEGLSRAVAALENAPAGGEPRPVAVTRMTEPSLEALQRAAREGFELVHLVADGTISLTYEGILYLRKSQPKEEGREEPPSPQKRRWLRIALDAVRRVRSILPNSWYDSLSDKLYTNLAIETCTPGQLSALTRGSRITVLSLSVPKTDDSDPGRMDGYLLPSVYKSFAGLGNSNLPLPNLVAPIGATTDEQLTQFWQNFYTRLAEKGSVEEAMAEGQKGALAVPMALFLRQRLGREFVMLEAGGAEPADKDPLQLNAELQATRNLMERLRKIDSKYKDLQDNITDTDIVKEESVRQAQLESELTTWTELEEGE